MMAHSAALGTATCCALSLSFAALSIPNWLRYAFTKGAGAPGNPTDPAPAPADHAPPPPLLTPPTLVPPATADGGRGRWLLSAPGARVLTPSSKKTLTTARNQTNADTMHISWTAVAVHRAPGCLLVPPGPMPRYLLLLLLLPLLLPLIVASTACLATRCKEEAGPGPLAAWR